MAEINVTVDGEHYTAEKRVEYSRESMAWTIRWFKAGLPEGQFVEAEVWPPSGVVWEAREAVKAAIGKGEWD